MRGILIALAAFALLYGCSVQKRRYRPGITLQLKHDRKNRHAEAVQDPVSVHRYAREASTVAAGPEPPVYTSAAEALPPGCMTSLTQNDTCDAILLKNGRRISARVTEVGPSLIRYKLCHLLNTEVSHSSYRSEVAAIFYASGRQEMISGGTEPGPGLKVLTPADRQRGYVYPNVVKQDAVLSMVLGIMGMLFMFYGSIHAIVLGVRVNRVMRDNPGVYEGKGFANAGIILGIAKIALLVLLLFSVAFFI